MENGAFTPLEKMLHFPKYFKYMIFQRRQKWFLWSKWLTLFYCLLLESLTEMCVSIFPGITHIAINEYIGNVDPDEWHLIWDYTVRIIRRLVK